MNKDDVFAALDRLENDALASRDGYGDARKDAEIIRAALTAQQQQPDVNAELLEALKECLPRIEEIRLVDLGAVRDAEMQDYNDRKILTRRELAETNELINKINKAISRAKAQKVGE